MNRKTSVNVQQIFAKIDELNEKYVSVWQDIANIESPTWHKQGVDEVAQYLINMAEQRGWTVEINAHPKAGNAVCITMNDTSPERPVAFSGHMDTVHPVGSFGTPAVKIDGNIMYGPGVMDCKGGVVSAFLAMDALRECGYGKRPIILLLQGDEECNSSLSEKSNINYMCEKAKDAVCFLNCESSRKGSVVLYRKGILKYRFTVTGKSIHASRCAEGASAILEAAHKIIELEKLKNQDGVTCNCGIINGGVASNTVPDKCEFVTDIRFANQKELNRVKSFVKEIAQKNTVEGCSCTIEEIEFRPAMEKTDRNEQLFDRINEIFSQCSLPKVDKRMSLGGSDAAEITVSGIPCVDSIAVEGDFIHTPKEFAYISTLAESAKRLAAIAIYI